MFQIPFSSALFLKHWLNYTWHGSRLHISVTCPNQPRNVRCYKITHSLFLYSLWTKWVRADSRSRCASMKIFTICTIDGSPLCVQNTCAFPLPKPNLRQQWQSGCSIQGPPTCLFLNQQWQFAKKWWKCTKFLETAVEKAALPQFWTK